MTLTEIKTIYYCGYISCTILSLNLELERTFNIVRVYCLRIKDKLHLYVLAEKP